MSFIKLLLTFFCLLINGCFGAVYYQPYYNSYYNNYGKNADYYGTKQYNGNDKSTSYCYLNPQVIKCFFLYQKGIFFVIGKGGVYLKSILT